MISKERTVDLVIIATIAGLIVLTFSHSTKAGIAFFIMFLLWGSVAFARWLREAHKHKKKLRRMQWASWLTAVEDRDIHGDIDFKDSVASYFLREKFESGCTPYEAISEWRLRKAEEHRQHTTERPN